jgi:hypothetical protein
MAYEWALPQLRRVLPLDDGELLQILAHAADLPDAKAAEYLQSILGKSPESIEFILFFAGHRAELSDPQARNLSDISSSAACKDPVHGITDARHAQLLDNRPPSKSSSRMVATSHYTNAVIEAGKWRARDEVRSATKDTCIVSG